LSKNVINMMIRRSILDIRATTGVIDLGDVGGNTDGIATFAGPSKRQ
jgi:hypothetical protein